MLPVLRPATIPSRLRAGPCTSPTASRLSMPRLCRGLSTPTGRRRRHRSSEPVLSLSKGQALTTASVVILHYAVNSPLQRSILFCKWLLICVSQRNNALLQPRDALLQIGRVVLP